MTKPKQKSRKPFKLKTKQPDPTLEEIAATAEKIRSEWTRQTLLNRWVGGYGKMLKGV